MKKTMIPLSITLLMLVAGVVLASGPAAIDRHVISSGGGHVQAGAYTLDATFGQPVAGLAKEAAYELCSGFRCRAVTVPEPVYQYNAFLPLVMREYP